MPLVCPPVERLADQSDQSGQSDLRMPPGLSGQTGETAQEKVRGAWRYLCWFIMDCPP